MKIRIQILLSLLIIMLLLILGLAIIDSNENKVELEAIDYCNDREAYVTMCTDIYYDGVCVNKILIREVMCER